MSDARDVVNACYGALAEGDLARARTFWSDDAVMRREMSESNPWAGIRTADEYVGEMPTWLGAHPDYRFEVVDRIDIGNELVGLHIRSQNGHAPGVIDGLLLWRVLDGKITAAWAIPGDGGGAFAF